MRKIILTVFCMLTTMIFVFADNSIVISGTHSIEGVNSGTRTYLLTDNNGNVQKTTAKVNNPFEFKLNLGLGNYEYTLAEEPLNAEGLTQDSTVYKIKIQVTNDESIMVVEGAEGKVDTIKFVDTYVEPEPVPEPEPQIDEPPIIEKPNPTLTKSVDKKTAKIGDIVTYTIKANSSKSVENAVITDVVPEGLELDKNSIEVSVSSDLKINDRTISIAIDKLDSVIITYKAKVIKDGSHKNIVELTGSNIDKLTDDAIVKVKKDIISRITPKTGDTNNILIWVIIAIVAGISGFVVARKRK